MTSRRALKRSRRRPDRRPFVTEPLESRRLLAGGTLRGIVFHDRDADSSYDAGEAGLPGARVYDDVDGNGALGAGERAATPAADGSYALELDVGQHTVRLAAPAGYTVSYPREGFATVDVPDNWQGFGFLFGAYAAGGAAITTFNDADGDAVQDAGEAALPGRTVYLDDNENAHFDPGEASAVSGADGVARFAGLKPGDRVFRQVLPPGWVGHGPFGNGTAELAVVSATTVAGRLGSRQPATTGQLTGIVYDDRDGSRRRGPDEPVLPGRTVYLDANDNAALDAGETTAVTDDAGAYTFTVGAPGTWTVRQVLPGGWTQTQPTGGAWWPAPTQPYVHFVQPGRTQFGDFGSINAAPGSISGQAYVDADADGTRDAGEGPVPDRTLVWLDFNNNGQQDSGESRVYADADGRYTFPGLSPGTYAVRMIVFGFFTQTDPPADEYGVSGARVVTVAAGQDVAGVNFGWGRRLELSRIEGTVFEDADGDGQRDATETEPAGRVVYIDADNDRVLDANERRFHTLDRGYWFDALRPGTYTVRVAVPPGYRQTAPSGNAGQTLTVGAGQERTGVNFGLAPNSTPGAITGTVYSDTYGDSEFGVGDRGWGNQTVYLDANNNGAFEPTETSTRSLFDGSYSFTGLAPGTYVVRTLPIRYQTQSQPDAGFYRVTLEAGGLSPRNDFGWVETARLGQLVGFVYDDLNGNGRRDAGEPVPAGRVVYLDLDNDNVRDAAEPTATQGVDGYRIGGLLERSYTVRAIVPPGYRQSFPAGGAGQQVFARLDTTTSPPQAFGLAPLPGGSVSGTVYNDFNDDGVRGAGENGLAGWTVYADLNNNQNPDAGESSDVTAAGGTYTLAGVPEGTRTIRTARPAGWEHTHVPERSQTVTVAAGQTTVGVDFATPIHSGDILVSAYEDTNRNGSRDAGEPPLAGWQFYSDANRNGALDAGELTFTTDANGRYFLNNFIVGTYIIRQVTPPGWAPTSPADGRAVVTVTASGLVSVPFGSARTASISGVVYRDLNVNGRRDAGDAPAAGLPVWLDHDADNVQDAGEPGTTTAADGAFVFAPLAPRLYLVRVGAPAGAIQTQPTPPLEPLGSVGALVDLPAGQTLEVPVGYVLNTDVGRVAGIVFDDANANGVRDADETGISGLAVWIDDDNDGILDAGERTSTTGAGFYGFNNVPVGPRAVRVVVPFGWRQTFPAGGAAQAVDVRGAAVHNGVNFGLTERAEPDVLTLNAAADAYVRDGTSADTKYGTAAELQVKRTSVAGLHRETYLRFDLSQLSAADRAVLRLYGGLQSDSGETIAVGVYPSANTTWPEPDVTWNTKPAAGTTALDTESVSGTAPRWYEWDVTDYVRQQKAAGAAAVTFVIKGNANSTAYIRFNSDEAADPATRPQLVVDSTPADRTAPTVSSILVGGSGWPAAFADFLRSSGMGDGGYALPAPGAPGRSMLPWGNLDTVVVRFSEHVLVQADDLRVAGATLGSQAVRDFRYDPATFTATWTLTQALGADRFTLEVDGDAPSGVTDAAGNRLANGSAPGDVTRAFGVLAGDATGDGAVNALDLADAKRRLGRRPGDGVTGGGAYSIFADVTGDGVVNALDLAAARQRLGRRIGNPSEPQ